MSGGAALRLVKEPSDAREIRLALLTLLDGNDDIRERFEAVCAQGVFWLRDDSPAFRSALAAHGQHYRHDEIESVLYALAEELLPGSWAAGWERLQCRVAHRGLRERGMVTATTTSTAAVAIEKLMHEENVWLKELYLLAMSPPDYGYLREVSTKVWAELRRRGEVFHGKHFTDYMYEVLHAIFPLSPGARWDDAWAESLAIRAIAHVGAKAPGGVCPELPEEVQEAADEMDAAAVAEDRRRYRRAVGSWVEATLRAVAKMEKEGT